MSFLVFLGSCQTLQEPREASETLEIQVTGSFQDTKTSLSDNGLISSFHFLRDDCIAMFVGDFIGNLPLSCTSGETGTFSGEIPSPTKLHSPSETYLAYYPYKADAGTDASCLQGYLSSEQRAPFDGMSDYLVANAVVDEFNLYDFPDIHFVFANHLFAIVKLSVTNTSDDLAGEKILNIGLRSSASSLAGSFTFDATAPEQDAVFSTEPEELSNRVRVAFSDSPTLGKENVHTVYAVVNPATFIAGTLELVVRTTHFSFSLPTKTEASLLRNQVTVFPTVDLSDAGVTKESTTADLLSFSLSDGINDYPAFEISDDRVSVQVPNSLDLSSMTAIFTHNGNVVKVDDDIQTSGVSSNNFNDFIHPITYVVTAADGESKSYTIRVFDLPIVTVETPGRQIINSKENWLPADDKNPESWTTITIREVAENGSVTLNVYDAQIKGRGNWTWPLPKKPYTFKLKSKAKILGMPSDKRWNLLANWDDRTHIRNAVALEIAHHADGMAWASHGKFVELIVNGTFQGTYFLCEHNKISSSRVDITEMKTTDTSEETITGGYLLEYDTYRDTPYFVSSTAKYPITIKSPDDPGFDAQWAWIESHINELETTLADEDLLHAHRYLDYMDIDSFIDYWFVYELTGNGEEPTNGPRSCYMHKDRGGKLKAGPVWDFDHYTFRRNIKKFKLSNALYYKYLLQDDYYVSRVKERWPIFVANLDGMPSYIDEQINLVRRAALRDKEMWPLTPQSANVNRDNALTVSEAWVSLKAAYSERLTELNTLINNLTVTPVNSNSGNENYGDQTNPDFGFGF